MRWKYLFLALGICLIPLLYWASGSIPYCGWDFRNALWGPIYMLVHGQTPYTLTPFYGPFPGVWMPQTLGAFIWFGLLSCDAASKLWLFVEVCGYIGLAWLFDDRHHPRLWILAVCVLALFLFPPLTVHVILGQFSMLFAILMIALAFFPQAQPWTPLLLAVGLTKPQLGILIYPGLMIYTWRRRGARAAAWMVLSTGLCVALLTLPLFAFYPGWVHDFIFVTADNLGKAWDLPTLFVQLPILLGQGGYIIWAFIFCIVFGISIWLWYSQDLQVAMIFSLALTPMVTTYASSWDFLLLLPAFYWILIKSRTKKGQIILLAGEAIVYCLIYAARWRHDIQDASQWWIPPAMLFVFIVSLSIDYLDSSVRHKQSFLHKIGMPSGIPNHPIND